MRPSPKSGIKWGFPEHKGAAWDTPQAGRLSSKVQGTEQLDTCHHCGVQGKALRRREAESRSICPLVLSGDSSRTT